MPARAQENPPEPDGYRTDNYRAPVPATLAGARVLATEEAEAIWRAGKAVFIDVLPRPPKPPNLPEGTIWRDKPRLNIPGSVWLPDTGYGTLAAADRRLSAAKDLPRASGGDKAKLLVIYCQADCWMSWNAAKRALSYGYSNVAWYPDGTDGWQRADLPVRIAAGARPRTRRGSCAALSGLFHLLLDHAAEREQPLVDRGRHLADEFDDAPPVLEDARLPDQLVAEFVDLGLIGRRGVLQGLQRQRVGADLVGGFALLAGDALEPVHDRRALGVERVEQAGEQQLAGLAFLRRRCLTEIP